MFNWWVVRKRLSLTKEVVAAESNGDREQSRRAWQGRRAAANCEKVGEVAADTQEHNEIKTEHTKQQNQKTETQNTEKH